MREIEREISKGELMEREWKKERKRERGREKEKKIDR